MSLSNEDKSKESNKPESGNVFSMQLLMKEKCAMPDLEYFSDVMRQHIGEVDCFSYDNEHANFAALAYQTEIGDKTVSPMLMISECFERKNDDIDAFIRNQMWDCPEHEKILDECGYQVAAVDILGGILEAKDRAKMLMDFLDALVKLYPSCEAVYFQKSGKLISTEYIKSCQCPAEDRFINYAVNVRFFNIEGTDDMLVDTLGMSTLYLPDLQYHFHGFDPNHIVSHAYQMLLYVFHNDCPIKNGDLIDGIQNGEISTAVQWRCCFEESLVPPERDVINIDVEYNP